MKENAAIGGEELNTAHLLRLRDKEGGQCDYRSVQQHRQNSHEPACMSLV